MTLTPPSQREQPSLQESISKAAVSFAQSLRSGRKAARAMWRRSRDPQLHGPNETVLDLDEQWLAGGLAWLKRASRQPDLAAQATPVCGAWQLQFMVHNFAPAVQKVVVEQEDETGAWHELSTRFTIEFCGDVATQKIHLAKGTDAESEFRRCASNSRLSSPG